MTKEFVWKMTYFTKGGKAISKRKTNNFRKYVIEVVAEPQSKEIGIVHLAGGSGHGYDLEIDEAKALINALTWALNRIKSKK